MNVIYTKSFWKSATERAVKTAVQTALPALAVAFGSSADLMGANWADFLVMVLGATILSYGTSLVSGIKDGNPSLGNQEVTMPESGPLTREGSTEASRVTAARVDPDQLGG